MDGEGGAVKQSFALYYLALVVDLQQIGNPHLLEGATHGVYPEMIQVLRVAHRDVAGDTLVKAELAEQAQGGRQALLAQLPLFLDAALHVLHQAGGGLGVHDDLVGCGVHC